MPDRAVAASAIEGYLDAVAARLVGPAAARAAILDELRDGLHTAVDGHLQRGADGDGSVRAAMHEFGPPATTAAAFAGELASARARRTAMAYLVTGPVVGLLWLLWLAPPGWRLDGPGTLLAAVPAAPVIVIATATGMAVLAATGRPGRWLRLAHHDILHGALIVVVAAALGDLLMLTLAARSAAPLPAFGAMAVSVSLVRLGCGLAATACCLRTRRILIGSRC